MNHGRATALFSMLLLGVAIGWLLAAGRLPSVGSAPPWGSGDWSEDELFGPCSVMKVVDGDTVDVICADVHTRVRLLRVDTPERDEPGYREASRALKTLIARRPVHLVFEEPGVQSRGKYGRLLAYLIVGDRNLNLQLVEQGWSPFYDNFGEGRFGRAFGNAEADAKRNHRGLWAVR